MLAGLPFLIAPLWACSAGSDASGGAPIDAAEDAAPSPGGDAAADRASWSVPECTIVVGAPVTFTRDDGRTLAKIEPALSGTTYTTSVIALEEPNQLLAAKDSALYRSGDSGCHWTSLGQVAGDFIQLVPGAGDRAYGYSPHLPDVLVVTDNGAAYVPGPGADVRGLAARPDAPGTLRLVDAEGSVYASEDDGGTWTWLGAAPGVTEGSVQAAAFGGAALDRVVIAVWGGVSTSIDGGRQWRRATGLSRTSANIFSVAISPADEQIVWVQGIDLAAEGAPDGRHIWISRDGGLHFEVVVTASADVTLTNGVPMLAHSTDPDILYFTWGTAFQGIGAKLYKVSAQRKSVTYTTNPYSRIMALTASPADASLLYLGLSNEQLD
ncbi:MAG TPA: hypothetical protein VK932_25205 [Kofleriaceae bacterium]|nr:hypothetical protein [Kofleriaceae bacterium]